MNILLVYTDKKRVANERNSVENNNPATSEVHPGQSPHSDDITPTAELNPTPPKKRVASKKIMAMALIVLAVSIWSYLSLSSSRNKPETKLSSINHPRDSGLDDQKRDTSKPDDVSCEVFWVDPILPDEGETEPLFLNESNSTSGIGYEGIIRRRVKKDETGNYISVDLVTNMLPVENSPYYLHALAVDKKGSICFQSNLGPLKQIPTVGSWTIGPFYLPVEKVNDAQLFVITQKGFGTTELDKISNLNDPAIILLGSYSKIDW